MSGSGRPKIVILGAGFAGMYTAQALGELLPHAVDGEITLIDENNFFVFTPMLTEVASGDLDTRHIVCAIRRFSRRINFIQASVKAIDLKRKRVTIALGRPEENFPDGQRTVEADHLVIALGSVTNYFGISALKTYALNIKNLGDAALIHNRALELLERADAEPDADMRRELLTFVVGGGGFSGVETMAALNDMVRENARKYQRIVPGDIGTVLVEGAGRLLPELDEKLAAYAQKKLEQRGVEVRLNTLISNAGADYVELKGGERIKTHLLIWSGGVAPSPAVEHLECAYNRHGGIITDEYCRLPGYTDVWAIGDCASIPQPGKNEPYPPLAQNATREGQAVARNIVATLRREALEPFVYRPIGELAMVGKHTGVASIRGMRFSGKLAWFMWRTVYLLKMPHLSMRLRVAVDWTGDFLFGRELAELPVTRSAPPGPSTPETQQPEQHEQVVA
ncbi:MAG TPA: NAD(P)/FAD-dependent oxidoreductase [Ktedonobacterales bacterium]|nr:NAD(P)/FAD-dependent oxidoreductase [Ktedonobacterales bacterium]